MDTRNTRSRGYIAMSFWIVLGALIVALVAGNLLSTKNRERLIQGMEQANNKDILIATMKSAMLERAIEIRNIGLQSNPGMMRKSGNRSNALRKRYLDAQQQLQTAGLSEAEKNILADIGQLDKTIEVSLAEAMTQAFADNNEGAARILAITIDPLHQQALIEMNKLVDQQRSATLDILYGTSTVETKMRYLMLIIGMVALTILGGQLLRSRSLSN